MNNKILLVSCVGEISDTHTIKYIKTLLRGNFTVESIRLGSAKDSEFKHYRLPNITINFWPSGLSMFEFVSAIVQRIRNLLIALFIILFKSRPRVIFVTEPDSWFLACFCKIFLRAKVIVDLREVYEDRVMGFPKPIQKVSLFILKKMMLALSYFTDEIIHVSKERQNVYCYLQKKGKIIVYYPDLNPQAPVKSKRDHSVFNVLHAGALRDKYGASEIIRAFDYLARNSLPIKLVVLGGTAGPIMEVDLLDKLKRKGVIEIFQQVSFDEVLKKMETSSIGLNIVLPVDQSHYLAQPRKLYEYLSRALPVIAADVPTIREVILKWKCGKLVDPYSDLAISKAIIFAFENKDWLEKAASQSFVAHCTEYNWQLEESKLIKVFDSFV